MLANSRMTHRWSWPAVMAVLLAAAALPAGLSFGQRPPSDPQTEPPSAPPIVESRLADAPPTGLLLDVVPTLQSTAADAPPVDSVENAESKENDLHTLDAGKLYRIVMQNGEEIVGEVVRQNDQWKVIKIRGADETITVNVSHMQSFRAYRQGKPAAGSLTGDKPRGVEIVNSRSGGSLAAIINGESELTLGGTLVNSDPKIRAVLKRAAGQGMRLTVEASPKASHELVHRLLAMASDENMMATLVETTFAGKGIEAAATDDSSRDPAEQKVRSEAAHAMLKVKRAEELAAEQAQLAEKNAKLAIDALEMRAAQMKAIQAKMETMAQSLEMLQAELAQKTEQLEIDGRLIEELRKQADQANSPDYQEKP